MARILVIEDDPVAAKSVHGHLKNAGHSCHVEGSGENALELARTGNYDALVLDVMLPGTSGFEICRRIRSDKDIYTLPILMLSAMGGEEEVLHGLAQGADDYVVKPYVESNLIKRLESILRFGGSAQIIDEVTELPGGDASKREIQRRVIGGKSFSLAYVEIVGIREFGQQHGNDARNRTIRRLGRVIQQCGIKLGGETFFCGHMGGGHFVAIINHDTVDAYCRWARKVWLAHLKTLYEDLGRPQLWAAIEKGEAQASPDILICVVHRESHDSRSAPQLFERLMQLRHKALAEVASGIYIDRRSPTQ